MTSARIERVPTVELREALEKEAGVQVLRKGGVWIVSQNGGTVQDPGPVDQLRRATPDAVRFVSVAKHGALLRAANALAPALLKVAEALAPARAQQNFTLRSSLLVLKVIRRQPVACVVASQAFVEPRLPDSLAFPVAADSHYDAVLRAARLVTTLCANLRAGDATSADEDKLWWKVARVFTADTIATVSTCAAAHGHAAC